MTQTPDPAGEALWRVINLAEKWENPDGKTTFAASVAAVFAAELRQAIAGPSNPGDNQ